jgi:hypothetical protein
MLGITDGEEMALQRGEMIESRKELGRQADAQISLCVATLAQFEIAAVQLDAEALKLEAKSSTHPTAQINTLRLRAMQLRAALQETAKAAGVTIHTPQS